jgi:hypothetical protein
MANWVQHRAASGFAFASETPVWSWHELPNPHPYVQLCPGAPTSTDGTHLRIPGRPRTILRTSFREELIVPAEGEPGELAQRGRLASR